MLYVYLISLIHGRKIANGATNCPSVWTENNIRGSFGVGLKCGTLPSALFVN